MRSLPSQSPVRWSARLYEQLLAFYPAPHRAEYGPAMAQLFRDLAREAYGEAHGWGLAGLWIRVAADTGRSAGEAHWQALTERLRRLACRPDLDWMRGGWPGFIVASLVIVAGLAAKAIVLAQTHSVAAAVGVLVSTAIFAAVILDRSMHAAGQLLAAASVLIVALMLPLAWAPDRLAWLKVNPILAYTVLMLPFAWRTGEPNRRTLWFSAGAYAMASLLAAQLIGP
jgi:hypothetical protein